MISDSDPFDEKVFAVQIVLHPARGIFHYKIRNVHPFAVNDPDQERTARCSLGGFSSRKMEGTSLSVQDAGSPQADVFASLRENQRLMHSHAGILNRQALRVVFRIIRKVRTAQQFGSGTDFKTHPGTQLDRSADILSPAQPDNSPIYSCCVNSLLNSGCCLFSRDPPEFFR